MKLKGKKGQKEARFDLIPHDALWHIAKVYGKGADKYAERNWERGYEWSKSFGALERHLALFWQGEDIDSESELHHIAHAAWHCLALLSFSLRKQGIDDRPKTIEGLKTMQAEVTNPEEIAEAKAEANLGIGEIDSWENEGGA